MTDLRSHATWNGELSKAFLQTSEWVNQLPEDQQTPLLALLEQVEHISNARPPVMSPRRFIEWWSGSRIEVVWSLLHQVQLELLATAPLTLMQQLLEVVVEHCQALPTNDSSRTQLANFISQRMQGPLREDDVPVVH